MPKRGRKKERKSQKKQKLVDNWCRAVAEQYGGALEFDEAGSVKSRGAYDQPQSELAASGAETTSDRNHLSVSKLWIENSAQLFSSKRGSWRLEGADKSKMSPESVSNRLEFLPMLGSMTDDMLVQHCISVLVDARHCASNLQHVLWSQDCLLGFTTILQECDERGYIFDVALDLDAVNVAIETASREGLTPTRLLTVIGKLDALFFSASYMLRDKLGRESLQAAHLAYLKGHPLCAESVASFRNKKKTFFRKLDASVAKRFGRTFGLNLETMQWDESDSENPLLTILRCACDESLRLFSGIDVQAAFISFFGDRSKNDSKKAVAKLAGDASAAPGPQERGGIEGYGVGARGRPLCPRFVEEWRNSKRDWPCRFYAYATPNKEALAEICQLGSVVEVGAGTGYWSHLLRKRGCNVVAYDKHAGESAEDNAYHRKAPPFIPDIKIGNPEDLAKHTRSVLFLCYPPPDSNMAEMCLQYYKGSTVAYVGEFQGTTATRAFERRLLSEYKITRSIRIPTFPDQICSLTIWARRAKTISPLSDAIFLASWPIRCVRCGAHGHPDITRLYRCRACRQNVYCSKRCCKSDAASHQSVHKILNLQQTGCTKFPNSKYFVQVGSS